jgi:tetratricopeptide (TPR) repeat protein
MKNFIAIVSCLFLFSCASNKKKEVPLEDQDISWVENADFNPVEEISYVPVDDYYEGLEDVKDNPIADEGLQTVEKFEHQKVTKRTGPIGGLISCYQGEVDQGIKQITDVYRSYKKNPLYFNSLGTCFLKKNQFRKAIVFYNLALKLKKNYAPAINNLGVAYYNQKNYPKAYAAFKEASSLAKISKTPFYNLGVMFIQNSLFNEFEIDRAEFVNDDLFKFGKGLYLLNKKEYSLAVKSFGAIKNPAQFQGAVQLNLALGYIKLENYREARYYLSRAELEESSPLYSRYERILSLIRE